MLHDTVDGRNLAKHLGCIKPGKPQLVSRISSINSSILPKDVHAEWQCCHCILIENSKTETYVLRWFVHSYFFDDPPLKKCGSKITIQSTNWWVNNLFHTSF